MLVPHPSHSALFPGHFCRPKFFAAALLLTLLLLAAGCGSSPGPPIAVFGSPDSPRMRQTLAGLEAALGQCSLDVTLVPEIGEQAQAELRRLRRRHPRLIIALGTSALMRLAPVEKSLPVVFALVGNPYFTGAVYDPGHPEIHQENVTGIASPAPLIPALQQGAALLGAGKWGLVYDPDDGVSVELKERFLQQAPGFGITPLVAAGTDEPSDLRGLESLRAQGVKVFYLPPAPSAARYAPLLLSWGQTQKVAVVSGHPELSPQGAVLWVSLDYRRLGEEAGALARRVLQGEAPARIAIQESMPLKIEVDETLCAKWCGYPPPK
jgi:putative tryptophan/tyrosine transport system substrate-binding protein